MPEPTVMKSARKLSDQLMKDGEKEKKPE